MAASTQLRLAVDIGGTFTDVALDDGKSYRSCKVLTTPNDPEVGFMNGVRRLMADTGLRLGDIALIIHGTTLATNAVIERRGARTALITTRGFRDTIEIGTESRFDQYDPKLRKPVPLIPREARFVVTERLRADGELLLPFDEADARSVLPNLEGFDAVAVAFLHAYQNPVHELKMAELITGAYPTMSISLSHKVCPEIREYERTTTTVVNAYVRPKMDVYLRNALQALRDGGFTGELFMVSSSGGLTTVDTAREYPVRLIESGPAGGAMFAADLARAMNEERVLSFDMGGTTAKVCMILEGKPKMARLFEVDRTARFRKGSGFPLRIPVVELVEIGAGGCSIASLDSLGRLAVGPASAAALPGPACFGLGGDKPTVTDADLLLGLLDPDNFADGKMKLDPAAATKALERDVGGALSMSPGEAAAAVFEIVCENMASAARVHAVEEGQDLRDFTMIAFGGAAPLHAARVAQKLGISKLIVPPSAGVGSAIGFLQAPPAFEVVRSFRTPLRNFDRDAAIAMIDEMRREAVAIVEPASAGEPLTISAEAHCRYAGQGHQLIVPVEFDAVGTPSLDLVADAFEALYRSRFGRSLAGGVVEAVTWTLVVSGPIPRSNSAAGFQRSALPVIAEYAPPAPVRVSTRPPVFERFALSAGQVIEGPAVVTEAETSTFVPANAVLIRSADGCLVMATGIPPSPGETAAQASRAKAAHPAH